MTMVASSVRSYLSAIGAAAIYVSVLDQQPASVGVARDLDRALDNLRRLIGAQVSFAWVAWAQSYDALVAIAKVPDLMLCRRDDGVKIPKTVEQVIGTIEELSSRSAIVLTPHKTVVERAAALAATVEQVFAELRASGRLAAFNAAYKAHRTSAQASGRKVAPYWVVQEQLRRVTIEALASSPNRSISQQRLGELISQRFPWFSGSLLDTSRKHA